MLHGWYEQIIWSIMKNWTEEYKEIMYTKLSVGSVNENF